MTVYSYSGTSIVGTDLVSEGSCQRWKLPCERGCLSVCPGLLHPPTVTLCGRMGSVMYGKDFNISES